MSIYLDTVSGGCCGVRELYNFTEEDDGYSDYEGQDPASVIADVFERLGNHVFHIWFVRPKDYAGNHQDEYEFQELRAYVQTLPGVVHLGEHINPNTGNYIDGYMFKKEV